MRISLLLISMTAAVREKHRQSEGQQEHPARLVVHQHYLLRKHEARVDEGATGSKI